MGPELMGSLVDKGISFIVGVYFTLLGFRLVGRKDGQSPVYDAKMKKVALLFKICGPILIVISILQTVITVSKGAH